MEVRNLQICYSHCQQKIVTKEDIKPLTESTKMKESDFYYMLYVICGMAAIFTGIICFVCSIFCCRRRTRKRHQPMHEKYSLSSLQVIFISVRHLLLLFSSLSSRKQLMH